MQASTVLVSVAPCRRHRTVLSRVLSAAPPPKHLPLHSRSPLALFRPRANTARTPKFAVAVDNYLLSRYNYLLSHGQQLALALQCGAGHGACSAHGRQLHAEASHTTDKRWRRLRSTGWPKLATSRPAPIEDGIECGRSRIRRPAAAHLRSAMLARTREQRHRLCATQTGWPSRPRRRLNRPPGPAPASPALQ